jgi:hypothetical protein
MSAPIRSQVSGSLFYAPPRVRSQLTAESAPADPGGTPAAPRERTGKLVAPSAGMRHPPWKREGAAPIFEGDVAIKELRTRVALNPETIPTSSSEETPARSMFGRLVFVAILVAGGVSALLWCGGVPGLSWYVGDSTDADQGSGVTDDAASSTIYRTNGAMAFATQWRAAGNNSSKTATPNLVDLGPPASAETISDRDEIAALVERGLKYFSEGDVATARLVLRRAARAGDPQATLTLGATYDPIILKQHGVLGLSGGLSEARDLYRKAAELGSVDAPKRLEDLDQHYR